MSGFAGSRCPDIVGGFAMFSYFREQLTRQVDETKLTTSAGLRLHIRPAGIVDQKQRH
ncbi:hypothetical protein NSU_4775 [Novosphingobium pentaromativorans US6-1]|uniref:Uncharacterized protein n=1 Tax=Novosphingobium pentaromativorans US6-1 TaxID=1088721 RepID=G6EKA4_9SPHN|nr:hypothetical protein NSU_4775 [Novosphingobium pentaromativorans US6-1]